VLKRFPFHSLLAAAYPVLALYAVNILEVALQVVARPLTVAVVSAGILLAVFFWIFKDWNKAGLLTSFILVLFFSYGHLYEFLEQTPVAGIHLGRHRYLLPAIAAVFGAGLWFLLWRSRKLPNAINALNFASFILIIFPAYQIGTFFVRQAFIGPEAPLISEKPTSAALQKPKEAPDIYYIILDAYTRGDALQADFGFDNSGFLNELQAMGFFVANCSRSNYGFTQASLTSTLNLDYLPAIQESLTDTDDEDDLWGLLKHSRVRSSLEEVGYQTVAFETGYEWSRISDAAFYLEFTTDSLALRSVNPFEALLIKTTLGLALADSQTKFLSSTFETVNYPYSDHINRQRFILNRLREIPDFPGNKFVFVHLLVPHNPFVFAPDGTLLTDPGFFGGKASGPINDNYRTLGYSYQVQFINNQILEIVHTIIDQSSTPPVIILQGDHGLRAENRFKILNAYYLAGESNHHLYPSISPVNSFRVIFNQFFGSEYTLLPDHSIKDDGLIPETSPDCISIGKSP
jgi:hypothetical protein